MAKSKKRSNPNVSNWIVKVTCKEHPNWKNNSCHEHECFGTCASEITEYLKTKQTCHKLGEDYLVSVSDNSERECFGITPSGLVYLLEDADSTKPQYAGIVLERQNKLMLLMSADESYDGMAFLAKITSGYNEQIISISPECIRQMFPKYKNNKNLFEAIHDNELKLIDCCPDMFKKPEKLSKNKSYEELYEDTKPPERGYTLIYNPGSKFKTRFVWHKPATLLFDYENTSYLFGQDDSQYFGVQLPQQCKNINDAFLCLIPEKIKNNKNVRRQGDYFFAETEEPKTNFIQLHNVEFDLYGLNEEGNPHRVSADKVKLHNNQMYIHNAIVSHDQHDDLDMYEENRAWYTIHRNTALKSVSQDGVD